MSLSADAPAKFTAWVVRVELIMKLEWYIDSADAGLSEDDLARHWRGGETPEAFVAWFAEKYDLIRFDWLHCSNRYS